MSKSGFIQGSFWRRDDRSGFRVRAEDSRREWNGLIVATRSWEQRHPQDMVKGEADDESVEDARPTPVIGVLGPLQTTLSAPAAAGATSLAVVSSVQFSTGDTVWVVCGIRDGAMAHRTLLAGVPNGTTLTLSVGLPQAADSGSLVSNVTAQVVVMASSL